MQVYTESQKTPVKSVDLGDQKKQNRMKLNRHETWWWNVSLACWCLEIPPVIAIVHRTIASLPMERVSKPLTYVGAIN